MTEWIWINKHLPKEQVEFFARENNISPVLAAIIIGRGLTLGDDTEIPRPELLPDINNAVDRIRVAMEKREHITIYGDYDVDGITGTALLTHYFRDKDMECDYFIPNRESMGYGVHKKALEQIKERGTDLIVTVDTGITAIEETSFAIELGMEIIITDHHEPQEVLPKAIAVVNPKRRDSQYTVDLCGCAVAFLLVAALESLEYVMERYGDLVAAATIADMVKLASVNRYLVKTGISKLEENPNMGLAAVMERGGAKTVDTFCLGFVVAPRMNAAGRVDDAQMVVELLLSKNRAEAQRIADLLEGYNNRRKQVETEITTQAIQLIEGSSIINDSIIVVGAENWNSGIVGIVCARLVERYARPVVLIAISGEEGKGSARSIPQVDIHQVFDSAKHLLLRYGGHTAAAGLVIRNENIDAFRAYINGKYPERYNKILNIDMPIKAQHITLDFIDQMEELAPFGAGNPQPMFALVNASVVNVRKIGDGKHIKFVLAEGSKLIDAVGFNMGAMADYIFVGDIVSVAGELKKNTFREISPQLLIKDIKRKN